MYHHLLIKVVLQIVRWVYWANMLDRNIPSCCWLTLYTPHKSLDQNLHLSLWETRCGLYLCVTVVINTLIVHFRLILADSKVKYWIWESLEKALGILQFVFLHVLWCINNGCCECVLHSKIPRDRSRWGLDETAWSNNIIQLAFIIGKEWEMDLIYVFVTFHMKSNAALIILHV